MKTTEISHAEVLAKLDRAITRCEKATKGPWFLGWSENQARAVCGIEDLDRGKDPTICFPVIPDTNPYHVALDQANANGKFIAAARTDLPAALKAMREILNEHAPTLDGFCDAGCAMNHGKWPCSTFRAIATAAAEMED